MSRDNSASIMTERKSIQVAAITGGTSLILSLLYFAYRTAPLFGRYSIGITTALLAAIITFMFFLVRWKVTASGEHGAKLSHSIIHWTKRSAVAFIHAALVFLVLSATFYVLQGAFRGLELNAFAACVIVGASVAIVSYLLYPFVETMTMSKLSVVLAVFLVTGVITSAMSMQDPNWWKFHFSALGAGNPASALAFNITLIAAGIVVVTITELVSDELKLITAARKIEAEKGINTTQIMLSIIGIELAIVGLFPFDTHLIIHNFAATGMVIMFFILIVRLKRWMPFLDESFYAASRGILIVVLVTVGLFILKYVNLTALELIVGVVIFAWFIMFVRQVSTLQVTETNQPLRK